MQRSLHSRRVVDCLPGAQSVIPRSRRLVRQSPLDHDSAVAAVAAIQAAEADSPSGGRSSVDCGSTTTVSSSNGVSSLSDSSASSHILGVAEKPQAAVRKGNGVSVSVRGITKRYTTKSGRPFLACDNVMLDIPANSITALLGPSGSGKTTLLRLIAGLEEESSGSVFFGDMEATGLTVQDRRIGFVFQSYALFNHMTVAQNVAFGIRIRKLPIDSAERVRELLDLVGLGDLGNRFPRQLSGGQMQRVAVARALASNPRVLLLDEPFGALDPAVRQSLRKGLRDIIDQVGITAIFVTHDQEEAFDIADEVVVFNRGVVQQVGSAEDLQKSPATPFVMQFISDTNSLPSIHPFVRRMGFSTPLPLVMFRPSGDLEVAKKPPVDSGSPSASPVTVVDRIDVGYRIKYRLAFDDGTEIELHASLEDDAEKFDLEAGSRVYIKAPASAFVAFSPADVESTPVW